MNLPWRGFLAAGATAFFSVLLLGPYLIRLLKGLKFGQSIRQDGPKSHLSKAGTPTMGGILILGGLLAGVIAGAGRPWSNNLRWSLFMTVACGAIGLADDLLIIINRRSLGLKARYKLLAQIVLASLLGVYVIRSGVMETLQAPFTPWHLTFINPALTFVFVVFVMVSIINAVNITDGLDGLAAGTSIIAGIALGILAVLEKEYSLGIFAIAMAGACAGFIWFNSPPAQVFMGDTGSLALGAALGSVTILSRTALFLPIIGGVFVAEALSVIIQVVSFRYAGRRVFKMSPLHHHYELSGMAESKLVVRFWIVAALLALLGLAGYRI